MADPVVFTDGYFALKDTTATGSPVELSGNKEIRFNVSRAELDDAVSGDEHDAKYPGRKQIQITVRHRQDFTTDGVDDSIWPKFNNRTKQDFEIRPTGGAVAVANPKYTFDGYITAYPPIDGGHGDSLIADMTLSVASGSESGAGILRSTS